MDNKDKNWPHSEGDIKLTEGSMWDEPYWGIRKNVKLDLPYYHPCRHCTKESDVNFTCPIVIIAYNEAGFCSTGVCAECIMEAVHAHCTPKADG